MERPHDVGGAGRYGNIDLHEGPETFYHEWEARVFALNRELLHNGVYTLDEFRYAIERMPAQDYRTASYYERWLHAIETLLREKQVLDV